MSIGVMQRGQGTNPNVDPWNQPLPGELWEDYQRRLYSERMYDQQRQQQDARTQMQMASNAAQQRAQLGADAAYQRSQLSTSNSRNQMSLADLSYSAALDKDREANTRVGSVTQSYRNVLGGY